MALPDGRVAQRRGELSADRHQEPHLLLGELAMQLVLHDEHAHGLAEVHERHREKAGEPLLTRFREIPVVRVLGRIREIDWLLPRCDPSDEPFVGRHPSPAHRPRVQSVRRRETYWDAAGSRTKTEQTSEFIAAFTRCTMISSASCRLAAVFTR